ncbi:hypothetical protein AKJ56_01010 [candidate division MSBL1 archaeon SCGC-AAA382N08]|uniref:Uncharacterized protein n=1 Tax=candidate division MSBL1 archaeon SCGC-AAA382N08 TaxID=1698285 RepID=A0A133VQ48_9EURY|nr:hypothetical protein AKJ56_01010 [candidate division MSBL1 archaeon SCGC-AAA382N08]
MGVGDYYVEPSHDQGTPTSTMRDTSISSSEGRLKVDATDKVFLLEPNQHPLVTLLTNVGKTSDGTQWKGTGMLKAPTTNPEFSWFEDYYGGRYAKISSVASGTTGDIVLNVTGAGNESAYIFTVGDVVRNVDTGENFLVTSIESSTQIKSLSDSRSFGSTAAAAISADEGLFIVGNASEEGSGARNINTTRTTKESNYTQLFKATIGATGTEKESELYGEADMPYQRQKKATEHGLDIERAFWWGQKSIMTGSNGYPKRGTGGVQEFIENSSSYVQNQGGPITAPDLNTFLREGFTYGSTTKTLFAGGIVVQAINEIARGQVVTKSLDETYGMNVNKWVTPFGTINIVHNPLFVDDYAGMAFLLDMDCFKYRYMQNRDTKLYTNVQSNDLDGQIDQFVTECGLERKQAAKCALLKGVTD